MLKLSKASKMPCRSWSLMARDTCPGSYYENGKLVPACEGCYAVGGNYRFKAVREAREHNKTDWKRETWVSEMAAELDNDRYFRWFDSGDCYSLGLAKKIYQVMELTPHCNHWLPTRMHKFKKFRDIFAKMESLPNVVVRYSSDSVTGETIAGNNTSTIIPHIGDEKDNMSLCRAIENDGKCGTCRACWNKDIAVIAYPAHGARMHKLINAINLH